MTNQPVYYIDTHLDTMWQSHSSNRIFSVGSQDGHIDLIRARRAGLCIGFFTGFPTDDAGVTEKMMRDWIEYFLYNKAASINQITNIKEFDNHFHQFTNTSQEYRRIGAVLHFEGAAGIDIDLHKLYIYHALGLRSMSLTWNETNQWAAGADNTTTDGLTTDGIDLLNAMVDLGIMIDVSHLNDASFWGVQGETNAPIYASHSNIRTPDSAHRRNLTTEMVKAIADSNGSIGINFCQGFLRDDENVSMNTIVSMISKAINMVGIDHVHIGSDMDGCTLPPDMKDITTMPQLFDNLKNDLSLSQLELEKIAFKNMRRIMESYWYRL